VNRAEEAIVTHDWKRIVRWKERLRVSTDEELKAKLCSMRLRENVFERLDIIQGKPQKVAHRILDMLGVLIKEGS
jgi:hypothetical protein